MVEFQSVFHSCQPWDAPVLLSGSEHPRVPLTRGHPQNYKLFLLLQRCYCSADRGLQKGCFPWVFFMAVVVPGPSIVCFHFCCTVSFQFASFQIILTCHERRNMSSDSENCYCWPNMVPSVLFSLSAGNNVFDLMLGACPKNSLNLCPSSTIHYSVWIYVGEALRAPSFHCSCTVQTSSPTHGFWGDGKTFLPPHCSCIHPCSYYFVVEVNPCFTALYVVPCMLSSLLSPEQPLSWNNSGCICSAQKGCVSAGWPRTLLCTHHV